MNKQKDNSQMQYTQMHFKYDHNTCSSAVRIVFFHFESNRIVIVGLKSHQ